MVSVGKSGVFHTRGKTFSFFSILNHVIATHQKVISFFFQTATMIILTFMMIPSSTITRSNTPIIQEHALVDMAPAFLYP